MLRRPRHRAACTTTTKQQEEGAARDDEAPRHARGTPIQHAATARKKQDETDETKIERADSTDSNGY